MSDGDQLLQKMALDGRLRGKSVESDASISNVAQTPVSKTTEVRKGRFVLTDVNDDGDISKSPKSGKMVEASPTYSKSNAEEQKKEDSSTLHTSSTKLGRFEVTSNVQNENGRKKDSKKVSKKTEAPTKQYRLIDMDPMKLFAVLENKMQTLIVENTDLKNDNEKLRMENAKLRSALSATSNPKSC